jgi:hypothetical protein
MVCSGVPLSSCGFTNAKVNGLTTGNTEGAQREKRPRICRVGEKLSSRSTLRKAAEVAEKGKS